MSDVLEARGATPGSASNTKPNTTVDPESTVWVVRAESERQADRFIEEGIVGIGWFDLTRTHSKDEIWKKVKAKFPNEPKSVLVGQLYAFRFEMTKGHYVVTTFTDNAGSKLIRYGKIDGPCESYSSETQDSIINCRAVDWRNYIIPQSDFNDTIRQTFDSPPTVFRVGSVSGFWRTLSKSTEEEIEDDGESATTSPFDSSKIKIRTTHVVVNLLVERVRHNEIDLNPEFQRNVGIWNKQRRSRLIESLLIRIPIPLFYVASDDEENWTVVDGIQRISTIYSYVQGDFPLTHLEYRKDLDGKYFEDLPRPMQRRIYETQLIMNIIEPGTPEEVMFNIFNRINTGGQPLNPPEIRNAMVKGPVQEYLKRLAGSSNFFQATNRSINPKRMEDRDCILRFLAFHIMPWESYNAKSIDAHLIRAMRKINNMSQEERNDIEGTFDRAMTAAFQIFGIDAFRKLHSDRARRFPINKSIFEIWSVALARCTNGQIERLIGRRAEVRRRFESLIWENSDFSKSISAATGTVSRVKIRFRMIKELVEELGA